MEQINLKSHYRLVCKLQEQENELEAVQRFIEQNAERLELTAEGTSILAAARQNEAALQEDNLRLRSAIDAEEKEIEKALSVVAYASGRTVLRLHFLRGMTWGEVGAIIGKSEPAARATAYREIKKANASGRQYRFVLEH